MRGFPTAILPGRHRHGSYRRLSALIGLLPWQGSRWNCPSAPRSEIVHVDEGGNGRCWDVMGWSVALFALTPVARHRIHKLFGFGQRTLSNRTNPAYGLNFPHALNEECDKGFPFLVRDRR